MSDLYSWLLALHIIAVIAWMAGMLYLPRLYVYHAGAKPGSELSETFKAMERRLLRAIINPAMIAAWIFGLLLAWRVPAMIATVCKPVREPCELRRRRPVWNIDRQWRLGVRLGCCRRRHAAATGFSPRAEVARLR